MVFVDNQLLLFLTIFLILVAGCFREEACCNYVSWTCEQLWHQVRLCCNISFLWSVCFVLKQLIFNFVGVEKQDYFWWLAQYRDIYTWDFLHSLGELKFHMMCQYLQALKHGGVSQDPLRRKWRFLHGTIIFVVCVSLLHAFQLVAVIFHVSFRL